MVKGYYRMISGVDSVIGRVQAALKEQGLADNTVIIFMGDNGYFLGDRGYAGNALKKAGSAVDGTGILASAYKLSQ